MSNRRSVKLEHHTNACKTVPYKTKTQLFENRFRIAASRPSFEDSKKQTVYKQSVVNTSPYNVDTEPNVGNEEDNKTLETTRTLLRKVMRTNISPEASTTPRKMVCWAEKTSPNDLDFDKYKARRSIDKDKNQQYTNDRPKSEIILNNSRRESFPEQAPSPTSIYSRRHKSSCAPRFLSATSKLSVEHPSTWPSFSDVKKLNSRGNTALELCENQDPRYLKLSRHVTFCSSNPLHSTDNGLVCGRNTPYSPVTVRRVSFAPVECTGNLVDYSVYALYSNRGNRETLCPPNTPVCNAPPVFQYSHSSETHSENGMSTPSTHWSIDIKHTKTREIKAPSAQALEQKGPVDMSICKFSYMKT